MILDVPGQSYEDTPDWWKNFIRNKIEPESQATSHTRRISVIKQVLDNEYGNAVLIQDRYGSTQGIFFPRSSYASLFLLHYS